MEIRIDDTAKRANGATERETESTTVAAAMTAKGDDEKLLADKITDKHQLSNWA